MIGAVGSGGLQPRPNLAAWRDALARAAALRDIQGKFGFASTYSSRINRVREGVNDSLIVL